MSVVVIALGDDKKCFWCRGSGRVSDGQMTEACEFCAGTGREGVALIGAAVAPVDLECPPTKLWHLQDG